MKVYMLASGMVTTKGFIFNRNSDFVCLVTDMEGNNVQSWNTIICSEN